MANIIINKKKHNSTVKIFLKENLMLLRTCFKKKSEKDKSKVNVNNMIRPNNIFLPR